MKKRFLLTLFGTCIIFASYSQKLDHVLGDILLQVQPGFSVRQFERLLSTFEGKPTGLEVKQEVSKPLRIWLLSFDHTKVHETRFLHEIRRQQGVQTAQFNHLITMRETIPNDPAFGQQWQWVNTGQNGGTPDADVDADLAWDITTGGTTADGREIVVCVVEGGNINHPDLLGNIWVNEAEIADNGMDDDGNGYVDDRKGWNVQTGTDLVNFDGHGTTVGGVIGAKGNNNLFTSGINWNVKLMYVDFNATTEANAIAAYTYPLIMRRRYNQSGGTQGAFVVATNSSWGTDGGDPQDAPLWCAFYDSLGAEGILSCGSTANNNVNVDVVGDLPTACSSEYLIAVTASNNKDVRTFSGYGIKSIDLAAPGDKIVSISQGGGPVTETGTSFSSPVTAGIIALLYAAPCPSLGFRALADPAGTAILVRDVLFEGVDVKQNLVGEVKTGGRINAYNSLVKLLEYCGPCPQPFNIELTQIIDTTAILSWQSTDSTVQTNLRWRRVGDDNWIVAENIESPAIFKGLKACTFYEFQLEDICADTTSGYTAPFTFETDGCCEPPDGLTVKEKTTNSAVIGWNDVYAAKTYNLRVNTPQGSQQYEGITDTVFSLENLAPCADYSFQVMTVCDTDAVTEFSPLLSFKTTGCGVCTDLTYCPSKGENATEEWIANVSIGSINNTSTSNGGYGNFTDFATALETYKSYPISLKPGFAGQSYNEWFRVWIDYNLDGDFDDEGEEAFNAGAVSNTVVNGSVIIPGSAKPGHTRMRVSMQFNAQPAPCDNNFNFGEVEDYCVTILPGTPPNCYPPDTVTASALSFTNATLHWSKIADALQYEVRFRKVTSTLWATHTTSDTLKTINNLQACTEYECQVRATCTGVMTEWTPVLTFTTACYPPCTNIPVGLDTSMVGKNSIRLHWNPAPSAVKYKVAFKKETASVYSIAQASDTTLLLNNLEECTNYSFTVQSICSGNVESVPSEAFFFTTTCILGTENLHGDLQKVDVFPNPFNHELTVAFSLRKAQTVRFELFDARGQKIYADEGRFFNGDNRFTFSSISTNHLPEGVYLVKMVVDNGYVVRKVLKR